MKQRGLKANISIFCNSSSRPHWIRSDLHLKPTSQVREVKENIHFTLFYFLSIF